MEKRGWVCTKTLAKAYFENVSGLQAEKIRKDLNNMFKQEFDLNITSETNLKTVNFFSYDHKPLNRKISTLQ